MKCLNRLFFFLWKREKKQQQQQHHWTGMSHAYKSSIAIPAHALISITIMRSTETATGQSGNCTHGNKWRECFPLECFPGASDVLVKIRHEYFGLFVIYPIQYFPYNENGIIRVYLTCTTYALNFHNNWLKTLCTLREKETKHSISSHSIPLVMNWKTIKPFHTALFQRCQCKKFFIFPSWINVSNCRMQFPMKNEISDSTKLKSPKKTIAHLIDRIIEVSFNKLIVVQRVGLCWFFFCPVHHLVTAFFSVPFRLSTTMDGAANK